MSSLRGLGRLFRTNDVVTYRFVKISNVNIRKMPVLFVVKMRNVCIAKSSFRFFFQEKISVNLVIML